MKKLDEMQKSIDSLKEGNSKPFDGQEQTGNQESNFLKTMFSNIL
jgi:hypothetical protein